MPCWPIGRSRCRRRGSPAACSTASIPSRSRRARRRGSGRRRPSSTPGSRPRDREQPVKVGAVTYAADVARIIQDKCQSCHRPGPGRAVLAAELRRRAEALGDDPRGRRRAADAPLARRPAVRPFRQRPQPLRQGAGDAAGLGRPGHAAGRRQGPAAARKFPEGWTIGKPDVVFEIPETYYVPAQGVVAYVHFRRPDELQGGHVDPGGRGGPGRPVGRPPHRRLPDGSSRGGPRRAARRALLRLCAGRPAARSCPRARPSGSPPARTCCSRSTTRPTAGSAPTGPGSG